MSTPASFVAFSRQRALAPDGRCKAFAAAADGAGFAEGVGLLVLERLSDARRNGHPVLALVRGSAVNSDGASNGLSAPNGPSQQRVIRQALSSAGLSPVDVDAVEAHGTGTTLGDPIEAQALIATYGADRPPGRPLWLGSVKSNLGHTQAAAGIAGVIKIVQAMRHGQLPKTLHVDAPTSHVDWDAGAVRLLTEAVPWPENGHPRRAGISAFGISGTNAHTVIEQAPAPDGPAPESASPEPARPVPGLLAWPVSAKTGQALRDHAGRLLEFLRSHPELAPADVAHALTGRALLDQRAVVVGTERQQLLDGLRALAVGRSSPYLVQGVAGEPAKTVFVFPGQGSQWAGMAGQLLDTSPVFTEALGECADALAPHLDWSVVDVLAGAPGAPALEGDQVIQPALFAVMVGLARLWQALGLHPQAVTGHSQGEIAAAHIAGALSLPDAAAVSALRAQALTELTVAGSMAAIPLPAEEVRRRLADFGGQLSLAAVNGPQSTVVSGDTPAVTELVTQYANDGVDARRIPVAYASHSPHIQTIQDQILDSLSGITPQPATIPFYSTLTGGQLDTTRLDAGYWYENLRRTVEFQTATGALLEAGYRTFVEVSPHPLLTTAIQATAEHTRTPAVLATGTLRRDHDSHHQILITLAELHTHGQAVNWTAILPGSGAVHLDLPTYPFQHRPYWLHPMPGTNDPRDLGQASAAHPLLGSAVTLADAGSTVFTGRLSLQTHPWLADHAIHDTVLLPGTAFLDLALHAGRQTGCPRLEEITLQAPLLLPAHGGVQLQVTVAGPDESGRRPVTVHSRPDLSAEDADAADQEWTCHATGELSGATGQLAPADPAWPPPEASPVDLDGLYDSLADRGYQYGPAFHGLRAAWRLGDTSYAEVALPEDADADGFAIHPALLDAALHPLGLAGEDRAQTAVPFVFSGVSLHAGGAVGLRARVSAAGPDAVALSVTDPAGTPVLTVDRLTVRPLPADQLTPTRDPVRDCLFHLSWIPQTTTSPPPTTPRRWAILASHPTDPLPTPDQQTTTAGPTKPDAQQPAVTVNPAEPDAQQPAANGSHPPNPSSTLAEQGIATDTHADLTALQ